MAFENSLAIDLASICVYYILISDPNSNPDPHPIQLLWRNAHLARSKFTAENFSTVT